MRQSLPRILVGLLLHVASYVQAQPILLKPVWETDTTLRTPESVLFDFVRQVLYVSCVNGNPTLDNKRSYIAKVGLDGKVIQAKFIDNLNATKGMGMLGDKLYVTEMTQVAEIALTTGKVLTRIPIKGSTFLNDIAIDTRTGLIYVTDSKEGIVWVLTKGKARIVYAGSPLKGSNGLLVENHHLLVGNGDGRLFRLNPATRQLREVTSLKNSSSIDGIVALGNGTYLINEVAGKIWHVHADGTVDLKLDTSIQKISAADTGYNPATNMVFVPTLFHNTVNAYQIR